MSAAATTRVRVLLVQAGNGTPKHISLLKGMKALTGTAGLFQSFYPSVSLDKVTGSEANCRLFLNTVRGLSHL